MLAQESAFRDRVLRVVAKCKDAAHNPASRIAQRDGNNFIHNVIRHDKEIDLTENHEGEKHNEHRRSRIARTA